MQTAAVVEVVPAVIGLGAGREGRVDEGLARRVGMDVFIPAILRWHL